MPSKTRKHFYAVSRGRCHPSIISSWHDAWPMVRGYPKNNYKGFNTFSDAREWLSEAGHNTFHFCQGPWDGDKTSSNEHSRSPGFYVTNNGRDTHTIFVDYDGAGKHTKGRRNSTLKSYADLEAAKAVVLQEHGHLNRHVGLARLDERSLADGAEGALVTGMASIAL